MVYNKENSAAVNSFPVWSETDYWKHLKVEKVKGEWFSKTRIVGIDQTITALPNPFVIPSSSRFGQVAYIGKDAFVGDDRLINVVLPDTVIEIGDSAFNECSNLCSINIPNKVVSIGHFAFASCERLTHIKLGNELQVVGAYAFAWCSSLQSVIAPESVELICDSAFLECKKLEQLYILNPKIRLDCEPFDSRAAVSVLVLPLTLAEDMQELISDSKNLSGVNWIVSQPQRQVKPYVDVHLHHVEKSSYTDGTEGWSVHFEITNEQYKTVTVTVVSTFLICPRKIEGESFWISGGKVDDCELEHNTFVEAISGFSGEDFDDSDFGKGAYIGIRILVDEEELNNDDKLMFDREYYEELLDDASEGYLPDLLDLPRKDGYTFVFRNSGTTWDLVETNILEKPEEPQVYEIEFADFVVRTNTFACNANHDVETVQAFVNILAGDGQVFRTTIIAGYCRHCNCYFILETDFKALQQKGKILCQLLTREEYDKKGAAIFNGEDMKAESVLRRCGYNVNASENLSSEQRQKILALVLDNGLYTATELCNFLDWLINYHGKSRTRDMSAAIKKWTEDRLFVLKYDWKERREVGINSISFRK